MTTQQIAFCTNIDLSCKTGDAPNVILCVSSEIVAPHDCPEGGTNPLTDYPFSYIDATIASYKTYCECNKQFFSYVFQYDDDQLIDGAQVTAGDIFGVFCQSCITSWVQDIVGHESYIRYNEDGSVTFISQHGCEYDFIGSMPFEEPECPSDYFVGAPTGDE